MRRLIAAVLALFASCSAGGTTQVVSHRVVATAAPTAAASVEVEIAKTASPKPRPAAPAPGGAPARVAGTTATKPLPVPAPVIPVAGIGSFKQLGTWIDVFDHTDDPASIVGHVDAMHARGVKTLYLETARYASETDIQFPRAVGAALDRAKAKGMKVVAWYPPDFADMERDVRRSVAAIEFRSPKGNRFDAFGADIEYTAGVPDHAERNKRTIDYSKRLRAAAGPTYPLAAIVIPPSWLERTPGRWPDFPWSQIKGDYDLFMPMEYWTALGKDPKTAYDITRYDVERTRKLTGRPVHIIGGLGADTDEAQAVAYVKACRDTGSLGGGLYDFTTTRSEVWDELRALN